MCKRAGIELDDFEALFGENSGGINEMMPSTKKRDKSQYPIADIKIDMIDGFPNHPFRVVDDEEMAQLIENISEYGVMHPVIVRKGINDFGKNVRYFLNYSAEEQKVPYRYGNGVDLLSGKTVDHGEIIAIPAWDLKIVEE